MAHPSIPARILLVEDHQGLRRGIRTLLERDGRYQVCAEAGTVAGALKAALAQQPRLAIVDLSLGDGSGIDLIEQLKEKMPDLTVLVLSMHSEQIYAKTALRAGASGYLMKIHAPEHLCEAVGRVLDGGIWIGELPPG